MLFIMCNDFRKQVDVSAVAVRVFVYSPLISKGCGSKGEIPTPQAQKHQY